MSDAPLQEPSTAEELADVLRDACGKHLAVLPVGHGTRPGLGALPERVDLRVGTRNLTRVLIHEPGDLTITVECGLGLAELDDLLAEHDQWLPLQTYRRRGTLGGLLASAADGILDQGSGRVRDHVLGARIALGDGLLARSRGRVVKNVAGYDLPRILVGSLGTLGVLTEVSLKLMPRPARQCSVLLGYASPADALQAAARLRQTQDEPSFVAVLCGACETQLALGFDGRAARVDGCRTRSVELAERAGSTGSLVLDEATGTTLRRRLDDPVSHLLPDLPTAAPATDVPGTRDRPSASPPEQKGVLIRWSGRPSRVADWLQPSLDLAHDAGVIARADARPGLGLVFLGLAGDDAPALEACARAALHTGRALGSATLLAAPDSLRRAADDVWGPAPPDLVLMRRLHDALDPQHVFARGRFVGGL